MIKLSDLANLLLLEKSWKSVRSKKSKKQAESSRGIDDVSLSQFEKNKNTNLNSLEKRLRENLYQPQPVKITLELKKNGKYRPIAIPTIEDRIVQRAMLDLFESYLLPLINTGVSYCGVKSEEDESISLKTAFEKIIEHVGKRFFWIFESDISGFYDNIPKKAILEKLKLVIPMDEKIYSLLKQYIFFEVGNPKIFHEKQGVNPPDKFKGITQGSALSPIFANLYLSDFDLKIKSIFGDRFVRYVDDFIVLCINESEALEAEKLIRQEISKVELELSPSKTHTKNLAISGKVDFLGVAIHQSGLTMKGGQKSAHEHLEEVFTKKNYKLRVKRNNKELDLTDQMEEKIKAWGNHYRFYHVQDLYKILDEHIEKRTHILKGVRPIKPLKNIPLSPIIDQKEWQNIFKKAPQQ